MKLFVLEMIKNDFLGIFSNKNYSSFCKGSDTLQRLGVEWPSFVDTLKKSDKLTMKFLDGKILSGEVTNIKAEFAEAILLQPDERNNLFSMIRVTVV